MRLSSLKRLSVCLKEELSIRDSEMCHQSINRLIILFSRVIIQRSKGLGKDRSDSIRHSRNWSFDKATQLE